MDVIYYMMPPAILRRVGAIGVPALLLLATGCAGWQRVGSSPTASADQQLLQLFDPNAMYTRLGRIVSGDQVPFIGTVALVPSRGDSAEAIVGLSLGNGAFAFERDGQTWQAKYRVEYSFERAGQPPVTIGRDEVLRVETFQETARRDESVLLQQVLHLAPGSYRVTVRVRDRGSDRVGVGTQQLVVPSFTAGSVSAPILAYEVSGRGKRTDSLQVVLNPRGTVAFGEDTLLIYFEGVGFTTPTDVPVEIRDERDSVVFRQTTRFTGASEVESRVIRIAPDSTPLGQLEIIAGAGPDARRINGVVSFSSSWVVTNFDDLMELLRYFGQDSKVSLMKKATTQDRAQMWRDFFRTTDPNPATPENEALSTYFARVAYANTRFRDEGIAGWRTDRGEAFITLGEPDQIFDESRQTSQVRYIQWSYNDLRVTLYFEDQSGFNRFKLIPASRTALELAKTRLRRGR